MKPIICLAHVQVGDVRVNLSRRNVTMSEQRLHRTRVRAMLHQVSSKTVTQCVRGNVRDLSLGGVRFDNAPCQLTVERATTIQEQNGMIAAKPIAHRQVSLQPMHCALADWNPSLFAAFTETTDDCAVQIHVSDF
jgi:hypothetical protein